MAKNKRKRATGTTKRDGLQTQKPSQRLRKFPWKTILAIVVLVSFSVVGLSAYQQRWAELHDLSSLGNGVPAVVQVHDPSCSQCLTLKSNTEAALDRVEGDLQYRIANLTTSEGANFAARYGAGMVTLLTFAADGTFIRNYQGVKSVETLARLFNSVVAE